ncbi:unnamed protein product, partial [Prorocentrum cordatum]
MPRRQDSWRHSELLAVSALLASKDALLLTEDRKIDTKTEAGFGAAASLLEGLDALGRALQMEPAPRRYRQKFTLNYRALFPDQSRNYRVDIFEASAEQESVIWVNGDKFEFSVEAMHLARELQRTWAGLDEQLERLRREKPWAPGARAELQGALSAVDQAWADFEERYISELIEIEERARRLIVQAVEHERNLRLMEATQRSARTPAKSAEYQEEQALLVQCISHLNSVANFKRKGRSDLGAAVLRKSEQVLEGRPPARGGPGASQVLATDVVESFGALRCYLHEVASCLERVDPHLCNNPGLVARLVDWEESWEVATQYMQHEGLHLALCGVVDDLREARELAPALGRMCEECDVELFMVLPRITWLSFFNDPTRQAFVIRQMLPKCFPDR